ncbi:D-alanyl-D-alanine carboxypeptidase/D-alanyl-D-alanine-endopeptidase [Paracoccus pacificus]|uniref:D-alanyl-D-alanine carboxypeptidase/D-alanyl-D-alanine-endopeptidase n=1 Tax=Paracoccus pacificus TaxID=1463598 RepID=A0ABW4R456_9RHOB
MTTNTQILIPRRAILAGLGALPFLPRRLSAEAALAATPPSFGDLAADAPKDAELAAVFRDLNTGDLLASRNGQLALPPASTLKIVTALFALQRLGPDYRFVTRVMQSGDRLILAGGGDPALDTDALADMARRLAATKPGVPQRFAVWGGALPRIDQIAPGQAEYLPYNPTISGMILNFNRVHLEWRRQDKGGYSLSLQARARSQSPRAYTVTAVTRAGTRPLMTHQIKDGKEIWSIAQGALGRNGSRWLPIRQPELYAGDVFQTLCRAQGLVLPAPEVIADLPDDARELTRIESPPLRDILRDMMEFSTNLTAEVVGLAASGAQSIPASAEVMRDWLSSTGVAGEMYFHDHSGLSPQNRISAETLVEVMSGPGRAAGLRDLMKHIPVLDERGKRIASPVRIDAKTGTLNFVSNLAGYAEGGDGRILVFAIFCADPEKRARSEGQELPAGMISWVKRAKSLQQRLILSQAG